MRKVFCIGFHRTGTSSLGRALGILGYSVTGPNRTQDPDISTNALPMALALSERYDAFQDNPWPLLYREMDRHWPGSKFVLTIRPPEEWIRSVLSQFGSRSTPMRQWIYGAGSPVGNEDVYLARYARHNSEVHDYFRGRECDLRTLDITSGGGWGELCGFLGHDEPDCAFPHVVPPRPAKA